MWDGLRARPGRRPPTTAATSDWRVIATASFADSNIAAGDTVELTTPGLVSGYVVNDTEIVYPDNVGVLLPRGVPSLTLVTCYPFYFAGDAPQRFILHAVLKDQVAVGN